MIKCPPSRSRVLRERSGLVGEALDRQVKVWIDADRARCFQQIVVFQKLLSYLVDLTSAGRDADIQDVDELFDLIPPTLYDDIISKFCFFFGATGTNKSTLDALFADGKGKIKDAMLATCGKVATARNHIPKFHGKICAIIKILQKSI